MKGLVPLCFAHVDKDVYRSSYPSKGSLPYIESLSIKTMICLQPSDIKKELRDFCALNNICLIEKNVGFNQEPFLCMNEAVVLEVIQFASDRKNQPSLIFCTNGKQRTNCVVGCYRKIIQNWSLTSSFSELELFAPSDTLMLDFLFIEKFSIS